MDTVSVIFLVLLIILALAFWASYQSWTQRKKRLIDENKRLSKLLNELKIAKAADEHLIRSLRQQIEEDKEIINSFHQQEEEDKNFILSLNKQIDELKARLRQVR